MRREEIEEEVRKFSFACPIRIFVETARWKGMENSWEFVLIVTMVTLDRDNLERKVDIVSTKLLETRYLSHHIFRKTIIEMARGLWSHEFGEWLKIDGVRVEDPHRPIVIRTAGAVAYGDGI